MDRVLVEPSGIYDMDEFFDVLHEEPLDQWYEIGNVIAVVDARLRTHFHRRRSTCWRRRRQMPAV